MEMEKLKAEIDRIKKQEEQENLKQKASDAISESIVMDQSKIEFVENQSKNGNK